MAVGEESGPGTGPEKGPETGPVTTASQAPPSAPGRWIRSVLRRDEEDDGVFRPVRLPLWMDLGISAAIIVFMVGSFAGFIVFLARTQGR